jgi:hypothetical protein
MGAGKKIRARPDPTRPDKQEKIQKKSIKNAIKLKKIIKNINSYIFLIFLIIIFELIYLNFIGLFFEFWKKNHRPNPSRSADPTHPAPLTRPTQRV